jgi:hypothetical protein
MTVDLPELLAQTEKIARDAMAKGV